MNKCPYCGKEYPDDVVFCVIDRTPMRAGIVEPGKTRSRFRFAIASEEPIPMSLTVLSYLYFLPGAAAWAGIAYIFTLGVISGSLRDGVILWLLLILFAVAIFFTCLSRGLRRCSRGWRVCALIIIAWYFLGAIWGDGKEFLSAKNPAALLTVWVCLVNLIYFIFLWWQYRVLTRPDIKELFGVD